MRLTIFTLAVFAAVSSSAASGETLYKCFDADGALLAEQLYPCDKGQKQVKSKFEAAAKSVALPTQATPQNNGTTYPYGGNSGGSSFGGGGNAYTATHPGMQATIRDSIVASQRVSGDVNKAMQEYGKAMGNYAKARMEMRDESIARDMYKTHLAHCLEMKRIQANSQRSTSPIVDDCAEYARSRAGKTGAQ